MDVIARTSSIEWESNVSQNTTSTTYNQHIIITPPFAASCTSLAGIPIYMHIYIYIYIYVSFPKNLPLAPVCGPRVVWAARCKQTHMKISWFVGEKQTYSPLIRFVGYCFDIPFEIKNVRRLRHKVVRQMMKCRVNWVSIYMYISRRGLKNWTTPRAYHDLSHGTVTKHHTVTPDTKQKSGSKKTQHYHMGG